jgi:signal transduction histidine kinase/CheY-like chemotaxis protein
VHAWSRPGVTYPPNWPDRALNLAARFGASNQGIVRVRSVNDLPPGPDRDALIAAGVGSWACVSTMDKNGIGGVLGFDALLPSGGTADGLGLLRLAVDAIANAAAREVLEHDQACLQARLQQARRMETVGVFASGIAHNFNNIIGAMMGHLEMADEHLASGSRGAAHIEAIRLAAERASDLVDQILAFGRPRDTRRRPVSVEALISESAALLRPSVPSNIELEIHDVPQGAIVSGEAAQLQQVILNLCNNAAQAIEDGGNIEIDVEVHEIESAMSLTHGELAPGRYVRLSVHDTGRGMDEAALERIFEPFFTTRLAGNGLGLTTVREIIREHGGAMNVWSEAGVGSRFEVWLPCSNAPVETTPAEEGPTLRFGRGETLLVVDDDRKRLLADEDMLAALGYEPVGFLHAADALAACRAAPSRFDALLIGYSMLDMPALKLAAALHEAAPRLPILLATASIGDIGVEELAAAGISEVVRRPLASAEIMAALSRRLAAKKGALSALQS